MNKRVTQCEGFKRVLFLYSADELKYSISNVAYAQGDVARVHDNYGHDILGDKGEAYMHQWKDVCEDGNWDRVKDVIDIAISDIEQMLYKFTATRLPMNGLSLDNLKKAEPVEYAIELRTSPQFSVTTADYLMKLIQEYIVDSVLEDWAFITYPEAAATWNAKKVETAKKISVTRGFSMSSKRVKPSMI